MIFSEKIKDYRKELGIKRNGKVGQVVFANELGISRGNIGDLERGERSPSKKLLVKLVEHSGKSLSYWMDGIDEYEAPNTVDLILDKMIETGVIQKGIKIDAKVWDILIKSVQLEIDRKLE